VRPPKHRTLDCSWTNSSSGRSAGGFSLEKVEISALKEIETIAKPGAEDTNVRYTAAAVSGRYERSWI
jgi:hypothetical protein